MRNIVFLVIKKITTLFFKLLIYLSFIFLLAYILTENEVYLRLVGIGYGSIMFAGLVIGLKDEFLKLRKTGSLPKYYELIKIREKREEERRQQEDREFLRNLALRAHIWMIKIVDLLYEKIKYSNNELIHTVSFYLYYLNLRLITRLYITYPSSDEEPHLQIKDFVYHPKFFSFNIAIPGNRKSQYVKSQIETRMKKMASRYFIRKKGREFELMVPFT